MALKNSNGTPASAAKKDQKAQRMERLEAQMRENLKKRKAASRARNPQGNANSADEGAGADD